MEKIAKEEQLWVFKHSFHLFWMPIAKAPWFFGSNQPEHVFFNLFHDVTQHVNGRQHIHMHQAAWGCLIALGIHQAKCRKSFNLSSRIFFNWTQDLLGHTLKACIWARGLDLCDDELSSSAVNETKEMTPWIRPRNCFTPCLPAVANTEDAGILSTGCWHESVSNVCKGQSVTEHSAHLGGVSFWLFALGLTCIPLHWTYYFLFK